MNAYLSFARAVQKSEYDAAWKALSEESQKLLTERAKKISSSAAGSVAEQPAALFFGAPGAPPVKEVKLVKEEGNVAYLNVVPEQGPAQEVRMVREQGAWKLDVSGLMKE